ncbi:MAG: radical SAM protein [Methanomicrobia archaeon]|nr:radical SAM protein [Methanomicrobia archaeon]
MRYLYGPVASWRLGRSLGVDILSTAEKTCSFECVYCQLGRTVTKTTDRRVFVPTDAIERELQALAPVIEETADVITFAGMGEPTLGANLGEVVDAIRRHTRKPIAILTNAALMTDKTVREELKKLDVVIAKLDAPDQAMFEAVNRPVSAEIKLDEIIAGLKEFRREYRGRLCLQLMFVVANRASGAELARSAAELQPDEVQLNTPLRRPCGVKPLPGEEMKQIEKQFEQLKPEIEVISVYERMKLDVWAIDKGAVIRRRGAGD